MKALAAGLGRLLVTLATIAVAAVIGWRFWVYYMEDPWTRDGRVRADVVQVAPDVSGLVSEVLVHDNQEVHKGDVLFRIDRSRFDFAVQQAQAASAKWQATSEQAMRDMRRATQLTELAISKQKQEQSSTSASESAAAYDQAQADLGVAKLNLQRSVVTAPVNGYITNFDLRPGDYAVAGKPVLALVDSDTFHINGYFEETKLPRVHIGDRVTIRLMGEPSLLHGHVQSISAGIADRERSPSDNLLPNINPTFSWIRLAQRVPVRIAIDKVPNGVRIVAGRTATVAIEEGHAAAPANIAQSPTPTSPHEATNSITTTQHHSLHKKVPHVNKQFKKSL